MSNTETEVNAMLDKLRPILLALSKKFPQLSQNLFRHFYETLLKVAPLNPPPRWAEKLADEVFIDWSQMLLDDQEEFNRAFNQFEQLNLTTRFKELSAPQLAAQLTPDSEWLTTTRLLAEVLTAAVQAGQMVPRLDPTLFMLHHQRLDADWEALAQQMDAAAQRQVGTYALGWMHPALRKGSIPNELAPAAATTHSFAYFIFHTLAWQLPSAADQKSLLNQIDRFRVYNPHLPPELRGWLREWLRLKADDQRTPLDCWQALAALVAERAARSACDVAHEKMGANGTFGRYKRSNQSEDEHFKLSVPGISLLAVADGVSTASVGSGGQASFAVRKTFENQKPKLTAQLQRLLVLPLESAAADAAADGSTAESFETAGWQFLETFFENCQHVVVDEINNLVTPETPAAADTMSSTLVLALVRGNQALIGHWGDSRAYRLSTRAAVRLTEDHNHELEVLSHREARYEQPQQGAPLIRVVGQCEFDLASGCYLSVPQKMSRDRCLLAGDEWLLLCSDGLLSSVPGETEAEKEQFLASIAATHAQDDCCELAWQLMRQTDAALGNDNIMVVLLRIQTEDAPTASAVSTKPNNALSRRQRS